MKNLFIISFISLSITANAQVTKALFLGNSYTSVNNLPQLVKNIALSYGDTLITDANTPGGQQFSQHVSNTTSLTKIKAQNWDYVILQEQSQKPAFSPSQVQSDVYPYAKILNDSIKANYSCSETVFYMTWGRKNGDASNCGSYPPICTYNGMQQRLRESYMEMADSNFATVSPVGVAWKNLRDSFPLIELYAGDESHPNINGSYLAACVFYSTLYQKSTIGCTYVPAGVTTIDALNIQTIATNTVLDSLLLWRINANKPIANFNYSGGNPINFTNNSTNGDSYFWYFGDGNTSTLQNPSNTYINNGNYTVQLITFSKDSCFTDTITQNVNVTTASINSITANKETFIYPNPASNFIEIKTTLDYNSIIILDGNGKLVQTLNNVKSKIDISNLANGMYFIKLITKNNSFVQKFVKE